MVKIVTDSCSGINPESAERFGVTVLPLYIHFGNEIYQDNIDLTTEEFYRRLEKEENLPTSSAVNPDTFAKVFTQLAKETDEILTISFSAMLSGTYGAALQGKAMVGKKCHIEVIDSQLAIGAQMLLVVFATKLAQSGANLDQISKRVKNAIPRIHLRATLYTLEYLRKGGRIGKAQALLGSLLKVNPILTLKDGMIFPVARPRSRTQAINQLIDFAKSFPHIEALAVEDATTHDELEVLAEKLKGLVPPENFYRSKIDPVIGIHLGPGVLGVSVLEGE
ncbi:MAG: DegV family protein [Dehalococcoidia bacterium]|nr:DegV family protein [Dehalococcoidia bacterium]